MISIYSALIWTASILLASFAVILFFMNEKRSSRTLVLMALSMSAWTASIGGFYYATTPELALFFVRIGHLTGSFIALSIFLLGYVLHTETVTPSRLTLWTLFAIETLFAVSYFTTDIFAREVLFTGPDVLDRTISDPQTIVLHYIYIGIVIALGIREMLRQRGLARTEHDRAHTSNIVFLIILSTSFLFSVLFATRALGYSRYYWLTALTTLVWLGSISYSLVRFKVVPLKLFLAEVSALAMTAIVFADIFIADGVVGDIGRVAVFFFFAIVSFFFIRLLSNYEHQKERLVAATESLEKANSELGHANKRLQELDLQRSKFVSIASHQLRAPLTAIIGYSSMLLENSFGKIPKKAQVASEKILQSGKNLTHTISDFLDASTLEMGQLHFSFAQVDLTKLVSEVVETMKPNARIAGVELSLEIGVQKTVQIIADKEKIRHVVLNLIDNAIHYTPKGTITVSLKSFKQQALLTVRDTGIGMSRETVSRLFGKFARGEEAAKQSAEGVGLGMYLAKEIVSAHKGSIHAESPGVGKGSIFTVELPLAKL